MSASSLAKILGLCIALPSNILGVAFFAMWLEEEGHISNNLSLIIILAVVGLNFFWIIRYAIKNSD